MNKKEFIENLKTKLKSYKDHDIDDAISYYSDLIEDKKENEKISEEDAVASLGDVNKIAKKITIEMIANDKESSNKATKRLLIVIAYLFASPLIFPLAICLLLLVIVFIVLWLSLTIGFGAGAIGCLVGCFAVFFNYISAFTTILGLGLSLSSFAILLLLTILCGYGGLKLIAKIASSLAKLINKKGNN